MTIDPRTEVAEQPEAEELTAGTSRAHPRVVICGSPGAGKSTLSRSLAAVAPFAASPHDLLDPPGDAEYLRQIVHGAAAADAAVIVLDDRGLTDEARQDSRLASVLGVRHLIVAVNKLDLAGYDRGRFDATAQDYADFAEELGLGPITYVPICAQSGENVLERGAQMPWYEGPALAELLDQATPDGPTTEAPSTPASTPADQFEATIVWLGRQPDAPRPDVLMGACRVGRAHGDDHPAEVQASTSTRPSISRRQNWSPTRSASATSSCSAAIAFEPLPGEPRDRPLQLIDPVIRRSRSGSG